MHSIDKDKLAHVSGGFDNAEADKKSDQWGNTGIAAGATAGALLAPRLPIYVKVRPYRQIQQGIGIAVGASALAIVANVAGKGLGYAKSAFDQWRNQ